MPGSSSGGSINGKTLTRRTTPGTVANPDVLSKTKHEEWTTSKKVVNHKTKQVETRVQRQIVMEDGKVIADSGPQVTTKTTEDNKTEETENTQHKTNGEDEVESGFSVVPGSARVVSEKTESKQTMRESKEESRQMHDESLKELEGRDYHQKALVSVGDLSRELDSGRPFQGKLTHFSSKSQKITDKEEVKEISEQDADGQVTTNTTRTHHHEELYDDEVPEADANLGALPDAGRGPRRIEYPTPVERRDAVTKKALSVEEEEEIRNCETNRWLEDHFGSDSSSEVVETARTRAGGNVINIQMSSGRKASAESQRTSVAERVGRFDAVRRSPTPSSGRPVRSPPASPNDDYSTLSGKTPTKTYYLGQEGSYHVRHAAPRFESTPLGKSSWKSTPSLNAQESAVRRTSRREEEEAREEVRRQRSPVQRSMSQRELFPTAARPGAPPVSKDDALIHKIHYGEEPSWRTLPRPAPAADHRRHKEYSEVHSFRRGDKTDRSVQVVLSDDDDDTADYSTLSRRLSPSPADRVLYARPDSLRRPSRQFYFGDGSTGNGTSEGYSSLPSSGHRYGTLEREDSIDRRFSVYSPLEGRRAARERQSRYSLDSRKWTGGSFDSGTFGDECGTGGAARRHFLDALEDRRSPERRQRTFYSNVAPSPPSSPPPRLIRFGGSASPSPPDSPVAPPPPPPPPVPDCGRGSWSRKARPASPPLNPPSFKPLLSPVEIKNMANAFGENRRRSEVTANGKGPVVVQIRDWGNR